MQLHRTEQDTARFVVNVGAGQYLGRYSIADPLEVVPLPLAATFADADTAAEVARGHDRARVERVTL